MTRVRNLPLHSPLAERAAEDTDAGNFQIQVPCVECDSRNRQTKVRFGEYTLAVPGWKEHTGPERGVPGAGDRMLFTNTGKKSESTIQLLSVKVVLLSPRDRGSKPLRLGDSREIFREFPFDSGPGR